MTLGASPRPPEFIAFLSRGVISLTRTGLRRSAAGLGHGKGVFPDSDPSVSTVPEYVTACSFPRDGVPISP